MNPNLTISEKSTSKEITIGSIVKTEEKENFSIYEEFSNMAHFDSGILPVDGSGILSLRHAGDRTQFVFQHAPGIYYMIWGKSERDKNAQQIHVAQPYRIVIGDHVNGELRGARHFYSPVPITSLNQPLYHCNVPNLNCKGYSGTSVGWICIYHTESYKGLPLGTRIFKTIERASGHEAYNDNNMSGTDGPRFYEAHYGQKPELKYLWDKATWVAKTEKEGFEWTLNPDLWIPILVKGIDEQDAHAPGGTPLTLEMAMLGNYKAYYPQVANGEHELSLMNQIRRADKKNPTANDVYSLFGKVFTKAKKNEAEKQAVKQAAIPGVSGLLLTTVALEQDKPKDVEWHSQAPVFNVIAGGVFDDDDEDDYDEYDPYLGDCIHCYKVLQEAIDEYYYDSTGHIICASCFTENYGETTCCKQTILLGEQFHVPEQNAFYCHSCHKQSICFSCGTTYVDAPHMIFDTHCENCATAHFCDACGTKHDEGNIQQVIAAEFAMAGVLANKTYKLCIPCFQDSVICACGLLKPEDTCTLIPGTDKQVCQSCVNFNDANEPIFVSIHGKA